jgi:hypothetical protein
LAAVQKGFRVKRLTIAEIDARIANLRQEIHKLYEMRKIAYTRADAVKEPLGTLHDAVADYEEPQYPIPFEERRQNILKMLLAMAPIRMKGAGELLGIPPRYVAFLLKKPGLVECVNNDKGMLTLTEHGLDCARAM